MTISLTEKSCSFGLKIVVLWTENFQFFAEQFIILGHKIISNYQLLLWWCLLLKASTKGEPQRSHSPVHTQKVSSLKKSGNLFWINWKGQVLSCNENDTWDWAQNRFRKEFQNLCSVTDEVCSLKSVLVLAQPQQRLKIMIFEQKILNFETTVKVRQTLWYNKRTCYTFIYTAPVPITIRIKLFMPHNYA